MEKFARRSVSWLGLVFVFVHGAAFAANPAKFGASPDNSQQLLLETFALASRSITVNIYEFDHEPIVDALIEQIKEGRTVKVLIETEIVRGMPREGWQAAARLKKAMKAKPASRSRLFLMRKQITAKSE